MWRVTKEQQREAAKARRWAKKKDEEIRALPKDASPLQKAAHEGGGVLVGVALKLALGLNGGCGAPTPVVGTSGMVPCGSVLHAFGKAEPYYCPYCEEMLERGQG